MNLELYTDEVKETFVNFYTEIYRRLKAYNRRYKWSKPSPQYWADMSEEYTYFAEYFKRIFHNAYIKESNSFTQKVLEDTYVYMYIALPRYG